jgi:hypothetical protein
LDKFLGSNHEGREKRDRGDSGNRIADERAYHRLAFSLRAESFYHMVLAGAGAIGGRTTARGKPDHMATDG